MTNVLKKISEYAVHERIHKENSYRSAVHSLMDAMGCAALALRYPECTKMLGPVVPGTIVPEGCRVPGTPYELDPVLGAFNISALIRWLDYNDTWLAKEWGHPSDNIGAILAAADWKSREHIKSGRHPFTMKEVLGAIIKAYEIQGVLALGNSLNREGLDHVLFVKVASTAAVTAMLGSSVREVEAAVSQAWLDHAPLRAYRHEPNTGSRKSWAAGDAASRAVQLALRTLKGEEGYPGAMTTPTWGVEDVIFDGEPVTLARKLDTYVIDHVLLKIAYPAEFHAQTALECAIALHPEAAGRLEDIKEIEINTHESAIRIISKKGPLKNPADRDHCLEYITAVGLIYGTVTSDHYEEPVAADPRIALLSGKMKVTENPQYSRDYLDPEKRSVASAVTLHYKDGTSSKTVEQEYPLGHPQRRHEAMPKLKEKFRANMRSHYTARKTAEIENVFGDHEKLMAMPVNEFMALFLI